MSLLDGGEPVPECILIARRCASTFNSAFAWNAIVSFNSFHDDFRLFYQRDFCLFTAKNIRTSFGQSKKIEIDEL
jgi:hypothetical protein